MRDYEYDLVLNPDINCKHHHQWFYFEVSESVSLNIIQFLIPCHRKYNISEYSRVFDAVTYNFHIVCCVYVALILLTTVFSMASHKIVMRCFLVVYTNNSLQLAPKDARIFVRGYYVLREANSFPRA